MDILKLKKECEEKAIKVHNAIGQKQKELQELVNESVKLEGEFRCLEKLEKDNKK